MNATHGYEGDYATEPFEMGMKRLCIHSNLKYVGMYSVQDNDNLASFQTYEAKEGVKAFAREFYENNGFMANGKTCLIEGTTKTDICYELIL